jgi:hypothetical protein
MNSKALTRVLFGTFLLFSACWRINAAETYVNLAPLFNQDAFASQAPGMGTPLDNDGRWFQGTTLPGGYQDGTAFGWMRSACKDNPCRCLRGSTAVCS